MLNTFSNELYWLAMSIIMTALIWIPYILNRMQEQGIFNAIYDPYGDTETKYRWAKRMMQAHKNAIENLAVFAPLVIIIELSSSHTDLTAMACMVYFFARLTHVIVFTFAIPVLRVVTFLTGFGAQMTLALSIPGIL